MALYECAVPRVESTSKRAEIVFAARDEGLVTKSGRPNAVKDILTEANGPLTRLDSWHGTSVLC